jgi:hypothetical protein
MVNSVTIDRLALCGVQGRPAAWAPSARPQRALDAAHVEHVGLHDVHRAQVDHAPPGGEVPVLLAAGDIERQRLRVTCCVCSSSQ